MKKYQLAKLIVVAALLPGLAGCGAGTAPEAGIDMHMAQAGRLPAPADVRSGVDTGAGGGAAGEVDNPSGNLPDSTDQLLSDGTLDAALAEIDALAAPDDVDADVFAELKAELTRLLGDPGLAVQASTERESSAVYDPAAYDMTAAYWSNYGQQPLLVLYPEGFRLNLIHPGDYDSNGLVNAADIVPLAMHLGQSVNNGFPDYLNQIDGDGNNLITVADIVTIARNYGSQVKDLALYRSMDLEDYPWFPGEADRIAPVQQFSMAQLQRGGAGQLGYFSFTIDDLQPGEYYWTRLELESGPQQIGWINHIPEPYPQRVELDLQYANGKLSCYHYFPGDLDGNLSVNISDITNVQRQVFLAEILHENGQSIPDFLDRNRDGHVGHADGMYQMTEIMAALNSSTDAYYVHITDDPGQLPPADGSSFSGGETQMYIFYELKILSTNPLRFEFPELEIPSGSYVWVDNGRIFSEVIQIP